MMHLPRMKSRILTVPILLLEGLYHQRREILSMIILKANKLPVFLNTCPEKVEEH